MTTTGPEDINRRFAEAFNTGDIAALMDLYEPDAVLVPGPGATAVTGHHAIRQSLTWLLGLHGTIAYRPRFWLQHHDIALGSIAFDLHAPANDPAHLTGVTAEVARRHTDGTWRYLIDHPFATS